MTPDLSTKYLGLNLKNPLIVGANPLNENLDNIRRMEDAGAGAVVLHSLFEEQITIESHDLHLYLSNGADSFAEAVNYFPDLTDYNLGPDQYLKHIRACKEAVDIPIIASLNGVSSGGWVRFAQKMEEAGADALELNIYFLPTNPKMTGAEVEMMYVNLVRDVANRVGIPVAAKIGPNFSAPVHMCRRLERVGAKGVVAFNRFYQPDFDLDELEVTPSLSLSSPYELLLRLRWIAIMFGKVELDFAVTGGVHDGRGIAKSLLAGAQAAQMVSAILMGGIDRISDALRELTQWMEEKEYESVKQMIGAMSQKSVKEPAAFERANYLKVLSSYSRRQAT